MYNLSETMRRKKDSKVVSGGNEAFDISYNRAVGGLKTLTLNGMLTPVGDCSTTVKLPDTGVLVAFFNPSDSAVAYVAFGNAAAAADPTDGTDAIAIPPLRYMYLSSGAMTEVKSTATCYAYIIEDDTFLAIQNG